MEKAGCWHDCNIGNLYNPLNIELCVVFTKSVCFCHEYHENIVSTLLHLHSGEISSEIKKKWMTAELEDRFGFFPACF